MTNRNIRHSIHRFGATKKSSQPQKSSYGSLTKFMPAITNWESLIVGFLTGIFVASLAFFYLFSPSTTVNVPQKSPSITTKEKVNVSEHVAVNTTDKTQKNSELTKIETTIAAKTVEPRFDFYTELTKNSHHSNIAKSDVAPVLDLKSPAKPINKYLVQAGAFKNRAEADALKATLTLNGVDAKIQIAKLDDGAVWNRVVLGPFKSEAVASEQKQLLRTLEIESAMILKQAEG